MSKSCWLLNPTLPPTNSLRVVVAYTCVTEGGMTDAYSPRFVRTYLDNPAGAEHRIVVICNGGELAPRKKAFFDELDCEFFERSNDQGYDLSGYQDLAERLIVKNEADFIVCFGESVFFHRPGWLAKLVEARIEHGPGMYGCFSSHYIRAHLNTTAFATDARLLAKYPRIINFRQRYEFEHGGHCYWKRLIAGKNTAAFVTWDGVWMLGEWRKPDNILAKGTQRNLLCLCNHTERYENADPVSKALWEKQSDTPFRA